MNNTKRVRIAVAVDPVGEVWTAQMEDDEGPVTALETMFGDLPWGMTVSIVEADVPAPLPEDPAVVRGEVVDVD